MRWCESIQGNIYSYSEYIVEFWNSITSLVFCFLAIYGYITHKKFQSDKIPWFLLFMIGVTSAWFHATLSFMGQFCDELSIILLITYCLRIYIGVNKILYYIITIFLTLVSWFYPQFSPPILLVVGFFLILTTYMFIEKGDSEYIWKYSRYRKISKLL